MIFQFTEPEEDKTGFEHSPYFNFYYYLKSANIVWIFLLQTKFTGEIFQLVVVKVIPVNKLLTSYACATKMWC